MKVKQIKKRSNNLKIDVFPVTTVMGKSNWSGLGLSSDRIEDLNEIGYYGKLKGVEITYEEYLNSLLRKYTFKVHCLSRCGFTFEEKYLIIRVMKK